MKRYLLALYTILICGGQLFSQGSGNTLTFSNTTRVNIPDAPIFDHPGNTISIEAWIFPTQAVTGVIFSKIETDFTREYDLFFLSDGRIRFGLFNPSNTFYNTVSATPVPLNQWTHVAATYSSATGRARIYINGVENINNNIGIITIQSTNINPLIGAYWNPVVSGGGTRSHFIGQIDEVRLWHEERTQQQIRDNMCRALQIPPPPHNLIAYYRLDETSGGTAADASGNGNTGTLVNFPGGQRPFSGAPIGNQSVNDYTAATTLELGSTNAGTMRLEGITGNHSGIHLYRVDALPSQTSGLGSPIPVYYGTFIAGGTGTTYSTNYNYSGTNLANGICEANYVMQQRANNSVANWTSLTTTNNAIMNTMISTGNTTRKEIILDPTCPIVLPVDFIQLELTKNPDKTATLYWVTQNEINNDHFIIERSANSVDFYPIGKIESKKSGTQTSYSFTDKNPPAQTSYYRLKQVDADQKFSFSIIKSITIDATSDFSFYPNPSNGTIHLATPENATVSIHDLNGKELFNLYNNQNSIKEINLSFLPPGLYFLTCYSGNMQTIQKLIIQ